MSDQLHVLLVEDSEEDAFLNVRFLQSEGAYSVSFKRVESASEMKNALKEDDWDLIISDYTLPQFSGSSALGILQDSGLDIPFIIVSGTIGEETAVEAMRMGAHDYIMKGNMSRLLPAVRRELREVEVRTARKRSEGELLTTQRSQMAAELATSIIHDLRGPMQIITTMTEFLLANRCSDEQREKYCRTIDGQICRMDSMTREFLDFLRGEIILSPETVDLPKLCEEIADSHKDYFEGIGINIVYTCRREAPVSPRVLLDKEKMRKAVINLVNLVHQAMPSGGELRMKLLMDPYKICFEIGDCRNGISGLIQIQPFTSHGKCGGTGLGLMIAQKIVEAHHGNIEVISTPGVGWAFVMTIPRRNSYERTEETGMLMEAAQS